MDTTTSGAQSWAIPIAIIIGFGLIAAAVFFSGKTTPVVQIPTDTQKEDVATGDPRNITPVTDSDHIRGNPNAPIMIVEYSDFDCPYCKDFHDTMNRIISDYGQDGKVAWVYRHFPLPQLHPNAPLIAEASECVAELGGDTAFWSFSDRVFNERDINSPTNITRLTEFATAAGVSESDYNDCMTSGRGKAKVEEDFNNAVAIGGRGTPHSIVIVGDQQGVINGAQPYTNVKDLVENLLAQLSGVPVNQLAPTPEATN